MNFSLDLPSTLLAHLKTVGSATLKVDGVVMQITRIDGDYGDDDCPHCGAKMREYWHRLTPGLVKALVKMRAGIAQSRVNKINPSVDLDNTENEMTKNERSNLSKLRFHGLIAKVSEDGERQQGEWLITRRGFAFLRGDEQVPARVKTYRNAVVDHDTRLVSIGDVIGSTPYFERIQDIEYDAPEGQRSLL